MFRSLKLNVFIITGSICSNKCKKQKKFPLIISGSPPLYKGDRDWSSVYSSWERVHGDIDKVVEE